MKESRGWFARFFLLIIKSVPAAVLGFLTTCMNKSKIIVRKLPSPMWPVPHSRGLTRAGSGVDTKGITELNINPLSLNSLAPKQPASELEGPSWLRSGPPSHLLIPVHTWRFQRCRKVCTGPDVLIILFPAVSSPPRKPSHSILSISINYSDDLDQHIPTMKQLHTPCLLGEKSTDSLFSMVKSSNNYICVLYRYSCIEICMKGYLNC